MTQSSILSDKRDLTPVQLEGLRAEDLAELRKKIHEAVDSMFDSIEYDARGEAVNRISVVQTGDVFSIPVMADVDVHLPAARRLELSVSSTLRSVQEELARLKIKNAVDDAVVLSSGYTVEKPAGGSSIIGSFG
jgi:hypothetical protein